MSPQREFSRKVMRVGKEMPFDFTLKSSLSNSLWVRDRSGLAVTTDKPHGAWGMDFFFTEQYCDNRHLGVPSQSTTQQGRVTKSDHSQTPADCRGSVIYCHPYDLGQVTYVLHA